MFPASSYRLKVPPRYVRVVGLGLTDEQAMIAAQASKDETVAKASAGGADFNQWMKDELKGMEKEMMKVAIKNAAQVAVIQTSLMFVPVVGQALSAVVSVVNLIGSDRYEDKTKDMIAKKQKELKDFIAKKQRELNSALDEAYQVSYRDAVNMALSNQPLKFDEHTIEDFLNPHSGFNGLGIVDKLTGRDAYSKARDKMGAVVAEAKSKIAASVDPMIHRVKQAGFRALLSKQIAIQVRSMPDFARMAGTVGAPSPSSYSVEVAKPESPAYDAKVAEAVTAGGTLPAPAVPPMRKFALIGAAAVGAFILLR